MKKLVLSIGAASILAASPAFAADLIISDAVLYDPAPVAGWTGFYAGAFVGGHAGTVIEYVCSGSCSGDFALNGVIGGLDAGYDHQLDANWVVGAFVQLPLLKPSGSAVVGGTTFTVEPQFAFAGGVRVGYAVDDFLPYAFAGVAVVNNKVTSSGGPAPTATHFGVSAGVGLEAMIADQWSIDGRYTYTGLGAATYNWGVPEEYGENSHNLTIGAHYRF